MTAHNNDNNTNASYSMTTMSVNDLSLVQQQRRQRRRRRAFGLLALVTFFATAATASTVNAAIPTTSCCFVAAGATSRPSHRSNDRSSLSSSTTSTLLDTSTFIGAPDASSFPEELRKARGTTTTSTSWRSRLGLSNSPFLLVNKKDRDEELDYQKRKQEWASRYTSVASLRQTFGSNRNKVWGDLDAKTARRLYKTLLPRALLELYHLGVKPEDLAPLAYQARVAAKLYARERCEVPARMAAQAIDGFRQWKRYGKFQPKGMSYSQVWTKYETQVKQDLGLPLEYDDCDCDLTEEDVTARICLKILERSCKTNEHIDRWILRGNNLKQEEEEDLVAITDQLERDVRNLLNPNTQQVKNKSLKARHIFALRMVVRARRRFEAFKKINNITMEIPQDYHQDGNNKMSSPQEEEDGEPPFSTQHSRPWNERTSKINNRKKTWQERQHVEVPK